MLASHVAAGTHGRMKESGSKSRLRYFNGSHLCLSSLGFGLDGRFEVADIIAHLPYNSGLYPWTIAKRSSVPFSLRKLI